jgi:hypothetical protein
MTIITDTPLLRLFLVKHLVYTNQACVIFAQIYDMPGLNRDYTVVIAFR